MYLEHSIYPSLMNHNVRDKTSVDESGRSGEKSKREENSQFIQKNRHLFSRLLNFRCFVEHCYI